MIEHKINFGAYGVFKSDEDGRNKRVIAYFDSYSDAQACAEINSSFLCEAKYQHVNVKYNVFQSLNEYIDNTHDQKRKIALAKLTTEERELLGLHKV